MARGRLRIYLGAAPGVGKTYAMLNEGRRRHSRGTDVVERITGVQQRETIPDEVVRRADQVELVDSTPEALRRRMAHGNIYPSERVDSALANYFRPGNLAALRELALLWVADRVDESLQQYMEDHGIDTSWETRVRWAMRAARRIRSSPCAAPVSATTTRSRVSHVASIPWSSMYCWRDSSTRSATHSKASSRSAARLPGRK